MSGLVTNVFSDDPLAAEVCISEADPDVVLLVIHSGRDQIRFHGLRADHARVVALVLNAPYAEI